MKTKKITVIGLGYIGLPTAVILANEGYQVSGFDINSDIVSIINHGNVHIVEPDLETSLRLAISKGRLKAFNKPQIADIYIISVPTPLYDNDKSKKPNIDYVFDATRSIASLIKSGDIIIVESTCPVGTTKRVGSVLREEGVNMKNVHVAYCPERVLPGNVLKELLENNRIVGGLSSTSTKLVANFYRTFVSGEVLETDDKTAEMCKLTENSSRNVSIAFANELSLICDNEGIDVWNVVELANKHPRVNILQPGVGVGGHCIAVDPWFIIDKDKKNSRLIHTAVNLNIKKTDWVIEKIKKFAKNFNFHSSFKPKIACLGLAYKPNIDDLRESPALKVADSLLSQGYNVCAVEPNIKKHKKHTLLSLQAAINYADIIVILVKHQVFLEPTIQKKLRDLKALDFCGALIEN